MGFFKSAVLGFLAIVNKSDGSDTSFGSAEVDVHRRLECVATGDWGVTPPTTSSAQFGDSDNSLNLVYLIDDRSYRVDLYNVCDKTSATRSKVPDTVLKVTPTPTVVNGCKQVDVKLEIIIGGLDASAIYTDDEANSQGTISFCLEMVLLSEEDLFSAAGGVNNAPLSDTTEVTFNHLNMVLTVDYQTDFTITGVDISYDDEVVVETTENVAYTVIQCQCTADQTCCTDATCAATKQSELLYLCLEVTAKDVVIQTVKKLNLEQGDPAVDGLRLPAITGPGDNERNALTTITELNKAKIMVTTKLVSAFYVDISKPVSALGTIVLDFKSSTRMRRKTLEFSGLVGRGLQEGSGASGDQEFAIADIGLAPNDLSLVVNVAGSAAVKISSSFILLLGLALKEVW